MAKDNPRTGSSFDDFLKDQGMYEEVTENVLKRALLERLRRVMRGILKYKRIRRKDPLNTIK